VRNFQHLASDIDVLPILHAIHRQPELWKADTYLRDYPQGPFGDTETIFVRFPPCSVTELARDKADPHECVWMDGAIHLPAARNFALWLLGRVEGTRLGRCMINKLRPGGRIFPHADTPIHANYWERYHLVLQGLPGASFRCGDETIHMRQGEVWNFKNQFEHEVINNSADDRIHFVIDIRIEQLIVSGLTPTKLPEAIQ
jgi:Aspartyl/Asparaginyl beta-hydroxylase